MNVLLVSQSPRRKALLEMAHIPFTTSSVDIPEHEILSAILSKASPTTKFSEIAREIVSTLAFEKVRHSIPNPEFTHIVAADTIVVLDKEILENLRMKRTPVTCSIACRARTHQVYTGVCIKSAGGTECFVSVTDVEFYPLDAFMEKAIEAYIAAGNPFDKAGGYGIQDEGALFIKGINGDVYTVIGLPLAEMVRRLT